MSPWSRGTAVSPAAGRKKRTPPPATGFPNSGRDRVGSVPTVPSGVLPCGVLQGDFAAAAARYFLPGQKVPKEPPGDGANRISAARRLILHVPHPWTPFTGAQLGNRADKRKGAGGVSIDLISISAAAQLLVTFQWCFDGRNSAPFGICGAQAARWVCVPVPRPGALALTMEARK